jgi:hypothetical protein
MSAAKLAEGFKALQEFVPKVALVPAKNFFYLSFFASLRISGLEDEILRFAQNNK